jgi:hypothetical protein
VDVCDDGDKAEGPDGGAAERRAEVISGEFNSQAVANARD